MLPVSFAPITCMPKCDEGVFGQAFSPKDANAQGRNPTCWWPTIAALMCPLSIIDRVSRLESKRNRNSPDST